MEKYNKLDNILKFYKDNKPQLISDYKDYVVRILEGNEPHIVKTPVPFERYIIYQYRGYAYPTLNSTNETFFHFERWIEVKIYLLINKFMEQRNFIDRTEHNLLEEILLEYNNYEII